MSSLIKSIYILINLETNQKINIKKIINQKRITTVKSKIGGYGDTSHQKGILVEEFESQLNLEDREFSFESPIGKFLVKNDLTLKKGDVFQVKSSTGKIVSYKILDKIKY